MVGLLRRQPPHRAARDHDVVAVAIVQMAVVAEQVARALVDEQQLVAVAVARQLGHRLGRASRCASAGADCSAPARPATGSPCAVASLLRSKARGRSGPSNSTPAGRRVPVMELRGGAEEALLADLALVGALGQVGMGLARGRALDLAQRNPVLGHGSSCSFRMPCSQRPRADLVELRSHFEQGAEIAFAEALVALALDDLEEDRADHRLGEDLQQQPAALGRRAVDQDAVALSRGRSSPWPGRRVSTCS